MTSPVYITDTKTLYNNATHILKYTCHYYQCYYGVLVCFIAFLRNEIKRFNGTYTVNNIRQLRADFGTYLLLGLEFLIASDILKTVVDPTLDELAILGGVVVVRTVLSVFLNKEIKELAENDSAKEI